MEHFYLLSLTIFLPLVGVLFIALFIRSNDEAGARKARNMALFTTISTFVASILLLFSFDFKSPDFQLVEKYEWVMGAGIYYHIGVDSLSIFFVILTTFLMPLCILTGWKTITHRVREYMIFFLLLETMMLGVFCSLDLLMFYIFFEAVLIPMFLIIGIWGGDNRIYASFKFFLYTLAGSVLFLLALLYIYANAGTTDIPQLMQIIPEYVPLETQKWLWLALFASFAVKVPMWPFHTWLPDAHVQAPTAGSVVLAGVLLKLGGFGLIRLSLPLLPDASQFFAPLMYGLSIAAIIYTSLVALVQTDMKKLIAYSSVAHMGFVTLGLFTFNETGIVGAVMVMLSHGLVSGALFMCVGVLYDRLHTKEIAKYGGVTDKMPRFAMYFMLFTMASVGLPATSGFVGEFLVLAGAFQANPTVALFSATGVVLGACYMLWLYRRVMFGEITNKKVQEMSDLERHEKLMLLPIALLVLLFGVLPTLLTDSITVGATQLLAHISAATS